MNKIVKFWIFFSIFGIITLNCHSNISAAEKRVIKLLALGNSFSQDAVEQNLHELAKAEGIDLVIGNMNIGGCSLDRHWDNISNDKAAYSYLKIEGDNRTRTPNQAISSVIQEEDWDYISIQQVSGYSGVPSSFGKLPDIMHYLRENATNPDVKFIWHQIWAYEEGSTHGDFPKYDRDQMKMYRAIVETSKQAAKAVGIDMIVPSGTAIQNGRTSYIGDHFTRDGYHLNLSYGRYTAACAWFEKLFDIDVRNNSFKPDGLSESHVKIARAAAHFAVQNPYEVTGLEDWQYTKRENKSENFSLKVDSVMRLMTLEEKVGQMIQYSNDRLHTGPAINSNNVTQEVQAGRVGSIFNVLSVEHIRQYQDLAMQSRLKIPLIFGLDVVHGMKTTFPIPLAEAASFDLALIEKAAEIAAAETSAYGIHWSFAPMVDISRDARWGRAMEGAGEDPWYGSQIAKARVKGFQGENYDARKTIMACAKHFAAYGAVVAGKDYSEADISENTLYNVYLPPFKAAVDAGVATLMNGFNEINGIPATAHKVLQRDLLKETWGFDGFVVSDWGSVAEIARHGMAKDNKEAARMAILAGCDMDMHSMSYERNLVNLVNEGQVDIHIIDDAVRRILTKKFELGLFDDPYGYTYRSSEINDINILSGYRSVARSIAAKSIVLLKNEKALPINPDVQKIALVGPLNKSKKDMLGSWVAVGQAEDAIPVYDGLRTALPDAEITYIEGYDLETNELKPLPDMQPFDVVIVAVGERAQESGEAKSKVDINVHKNHQRLVKVLKEESGRPVVTLLMGGRPLIFSDMEPFSDAILMTWWLGAEAGNAIADVLTGKHNPSGKLPMTFPKHVGQCPIYYGHKNTGRPWQPNNRYVTGYMDETVLPAYPFGFGLSYTSFEIGNPVVDKEKYNMGDTLHITVNVKNTGSMAGTETVQLYLRDMVSSVTRPVLELCGIQQIELPPGEEHQIVFTLTTDDLGFYGAGNKFIIESGEFTLFAGNSSDNLHSSSFELMDKATK